MGIPGFAHYTLTHKLCGSRWDGSISGQIITNGDPDETAQHNTHVQILRVLKGSLIICACTIGGEWSTREFGWRWLVAVQLTLTQTSPPWLGTWFESNSQSHKDWGTYTYQRLGRGTRILTSWVHVNVTNLGKGLNNPSQILTENCSRCSKI